MSIKYKICEASSIKSIQEGTSWYIEAYTNTKNHPDSYGDIPTGDNVYDLSRYQKNPLLLVDHHNSAGMIAGVAVESKEDSNGLFQRFKLMDNPVNPYVAHAIQAVKEGLVKAFSIGGNWEYDKSNRSILTKAHIYEVSLVGVPADEFAVANSVFQKSMKADQVDDMALAELLVAKYRVSGNDIYIKMLQNLKGQKNVSFRKD